MKTALLLIDIQKDYFPGGRMELVKPLDAAKKAYELLQCFREHHQHHVHIQHVALKPDATFFIRGTDGTDIHDSVAHFEGEPLVIKHYPNSFRETNLLELLKSWNVERVIVTGMMTHMCVDATAPRRGGLRLSSHRRRRRLRHARFEIWRYGHSRRACPQGISRRTQIVRSGDDN